MVQAEDAPVLASMTGICKTFPGVRALDNAELTIRQGEILGLVGKNGAGKSTLINILTGLLQPDAGRITIGPREFARLSRREAIRNGVALVPQFPKLVPGLSVAENMLCGQLPRDRLGFVRWRAVFREVESRLERLNLSVDCRAAAETLRASEQKMVEIARAIFTQARIIILDEPTAALPLRDIDMLFDFIRSLRARGVSFIYISHRLNEVFELCDRVTVLRDGRTVGTYPVSELDPAQLVRLISGADVTPYRRTRVEEARQPVLRMEGCSCPGAFRNVSLDAKAGEVVGLTGLRGSGASEVAQALYGLRAWTSGKVFLDGREIGPPRPGHALRLGIAYIPEDRRRAGVVGMRSVKENVSLCVLNRLVSRLGFIDSRRERVFVSRHVTQLEIATPSQEQPVEFLSGGNQQKVLFARAAGIQPKLLILEEPTQGIDVRTKGEIYRIIDELARAGVAVLIVSTEIQELLDNCDRILVFFGGELKDQVFPTAPRWVEEEMVMMVEGKS